MHNPNNPPTADPRREQFRAGAIQDVEEQIAEGATHLVRDNQRELRFLDSKNPDHQAEIAGNPGKYVSLVDDKNKAIELIIDTHHDDFMSL